MGDREGGGLGSGFYVPEGLISMVEKDVFGTALIKKRRYWLKGVQVEDIIRQMQKRRLARWTRFNV